MDTRQWDEFVGQVVEGVERELDRVKPTAEAMDAHMVRFESNLTVLGDGKFTTGFNVGGRSGHPLWDEDDEEDTDGA